MSVIDPFYQGTHRMQFDGSPLASENCTPTSGANGVRASTGGKVDVSGGAVRALLRRDEETSPNTRGWSLADLDLAMTRLRTPAYPKGIPFVIGRDGWAGVRQAHREGMFVVLQGDSEEFPNGTCSGVFDGDHAVGIHPDSNGSLWLLADPICRNRRWESEAILRRYASNFRPTISYGVFTTPVPRITVPPETALGWTRVTGAWWIYHVKGTKATDFAGTTREQKVTKGFSANVGEIREGRWGDRERRFGLLLKPSAYANTWVDLLDEPNVRDFT